MSIKLEIKGAKEVNKMFKRFGEEGERELEIVTFANAEDITTDAKRLAPVDTGKLQQSGYTSKVEDKSDLIVYQSAFSAPYAPYIEFGTGADVDLSYLTQAGISKSYASQFRGKGIRKVNLPAQAFLYPAFILNRQQYFDNLKNAFNRLIKRL